ncbi:hydroxysteroid dehydrogenase-like protein 2 [Eurytemora carolleeae]|uniref:hydroxysteroid dehydrogenase-like protein 2 n=1 Tax=Eurytemora carolleeae TaxID=1294199 RepID=UPI000C7922E7|nr:hydroxysteroid dehydrogenase-like protein 2 [Eurytemora carolleeae]|eukprot:XP_023344016.1 hydroxysteroid dehydrogenase-like protein 2 [Eurytemora affinis]
MNVIFVFSKLAGKVIYVTGGSRGIGLTMALKAARDGAKIVVAAKTADPHPKLPGTIYTAAKEIEAAGGQALPCIVDVRDEGQVQASIEQAVKHFGGIDILINNASAISLTGTQETDMKRFDLMHQINTRGTYLVSKCALPYLKESAKKGRNPHILNNSPPLSMNPRWFRDHVAYTMAKYGMSMCVLGMSEEFKKDGIAVNAIWPKTAIITAAMEMLGGGKDIASQCRKPDIMADAAYVILTRDARNFTGNFCVDEKVLREEGVTDFSQYLAAPGQKEEDLMPDFFLDEFLEIEQKNLVERQTAKVQSGSSSSPAAANSGSIEQTFEKVSEYFSEDIVKKTNAVFAFSIPDDNSEWYIDLKNGAGSYGKGQPASAADVTFTLKSADFGKMFSGKLKPTTAFMTGKLKIAGNMGKAMSLEKLMGKMQKRSFSTSIQPRSPKSKL